MAAERRFFTTVEMMIAKAIMSNTPTNTPTTMPKSRENPGAVLVTVVFSVDKRERTMVSKASLSSLKIGLGFTEGYSNSAM
ncbi:hypothetical protein E2C01_044051 [Portunus trituberculatus]|uniref:Uncharacterized protein n=1 Tax=Portunus trituberculatus TaxID=210409 RepID=A0A5B7FXS8_PORTR|nr:hypothetical protein [Portunus trituberculatus]